MSSCILYSSATVTLIDIPRSIEQAQSSSICSTPQSQRLRLISQQPLEHPYSSVEPRLTTKPLVKVKAKAKAKAIAAQTSPPSLQDLIRQKHLQFALDELKEAYDGPWCLPRVTVEDAERDGEGDGCGMREGKRRKLGPAHEDADADADAIPALHPREDNGRGEEKEKENVNMVLAGDSFHFRNPTQSVLHVIFGNNKEIATIPPQTQALQGDITETVHIFKASAPKFDVVLLDPPWPNRSARRKGSYSISYGPAEMRSLLSCIPLQEHVVAEGGIIAVWVTNRASCWEVMLGEGGLFEKWGVELVEEWIWVKVARDGEPVFGLDSTSRRPYEVLLVGRRRCGGSLDADADGNVDVDVKRRVLVGVPDVHSRKPNLRALLEGLVGKRAGEYEALEIFARNSTAGWWSWGNEVLKFQTQEHWAEP